MLLRLNHAWPLALLAVIVSTGCSSLKMARLALVTTLLFSLTGCAIGLTGDAGDDDPFANLPFVERALGTVKVATIIDGEPFYVLAPDAQYGTAYAPTRLPEAFRHEGMRVVFSGEVLPVPPNVRMIAPQIVLSDITHTW